MRIWCFRCEFTATPGSPARACAGCFALSPEGYTAPAVRCIHRQPTNGFTTIALFSLSPILPVGEDNDAPISMSTATTGAVVFAAKSQSVPAEIPQAVVIHILLSSARPQRRRRPAFNPAGDVQEDRNPYVPLEIIPGG